MRRPKPRALKPPAHRHDRGPRRVLDALSAALWAPGESVEQSAGRALVTAAATKTATNDEVLGALASLRKSLDDAESTGVDCESTGGLMAAAGTLGGYILTMGESEAKSARYGAAKALLDEYREWRHLTELAQRVKDSKQQGSSATYDVDFIIATVPDYVDSNSGWLADENLAAIQSSMVRNNYVLDRPQLVDWSRSTARADGLTSTSRLHERQPGALLFRKVDPEADVPITCSCRWCCWCSRRRPPACIMPRFGTPRRSSGPGSAARGSRDGCCASSGHRSRDPPYRSPSSSTRSAATTAPPSRKHGWCPDPRRRIRMSKR